MTPRRAFSSCVIGSKPAGGVTRRVTPVESVKMRVAAQASQGEDAGTAASALTVSTSQPSGRKSHAVLSLGWGMPAVSGLLKVHAVPTRPLLAKEPGVVP